ncbi:hypothetical protein ACQ4PT_035220 [Festuca glaucescens]
MEPDDALAPAFKPGDYLDDAELERLLPKLGVEAGLVPGDFVDERHLDIVVGLVSQASRRDADKAEEWRLVAKEQGKIFIDLGSDDELNMDCVDVRYHWGGRYVTSDGVMQYTGGRAATSSIEVDKLSLPELKGHVGDHIPAAKEHSLSKELVLRWKPRGTGFADLTILHDDKGVQGMLSSYGPGHTVDVYVQLPKSIQHLANGSQKQNPGFPDGGREKKNQQINDLRQLRATLKQNNYQEIKFHSWFTILDAIQDGGRIDDVPSPEWNDVLPPHSMGQITNLETCAGGSLQGDQPPKSQGKQLNINALPNESYEVGGRLLRLRKQDPQKSEVGERLLKPRKKDPQKSDVGGRLLIPRKKDTQKTLVEGRILRSPKKVRKKVGNSGAPSAEVRSGEEREKRGRSKKLIDTAPKKQAKVRSGDEEHGNRGRNKKLRNPLTRNQGEVRSGDEDRRTSPLNLKSNSKSPRKNKGQPAELRSVDKDNRSPLISKSKRNAPRKNIVQPDTGGRAVDGATSSDEQANNERQSNDNDNDGAATPSDEHEKNERQSNYNDNDAVDNENIVVPGTASTDQGKSLAHTDGCRPEDEFFHYEVHGIKYKNDYLLGVVTIPISYVPMAVEDEADNWTQTKSSSTHRIRGVSCQCSYYQRDSPIGRLERTVWLCSQIPTAAVLHTRCFEPKSSHCPTVPEEIDGLRNRVRHVFDALRKQTV